MRRRVQVVLSLAPFLKEERIPLGIDVETFHEHEDVITGAFDGIVPMITTRVGAAEMDRVKGLKVIANYGAGYDNIDLAAAKARGIAVSNTPGVLTESTAELTLALILATARRIVEGERLLRSGKWQGWSPTQLLGMELKGGVLGIVGAGRIGRAVGLRAAALGMGVRYWSRHRHPDWEAECGAEQLDLPTLLSVCDVVTIHLAKSPDTERLIDARALARLKNGAILINTSRGAVVDEEALIRELRSGRISAGLDVYPNEPHIAPELMAFDNVVLLPHIGSATHRARQAMWDLAWANLLRGIEGKPVINPV